MHTVGLLHTWNLYAEVPHHYWKYCWLNCGIQNPRTQRTDHIFTGGKKTKTKNEGTTRPVQPKPVLFKGQLQFCLCFYFTAVEQGRGGVGGGTQDRRAGAYCRGGGVFWTGTGLTQETAASLQGRPRTLAVLQTLVPSLSHGVKEGWSRAVLNPGYIIASPGKLEKLWCLSSG